MNYMVRNADMRGKPKYDKKTRQHTVSEVIKQQNDGLIQTSGKCHEELKAETLVLE